MNMRSFENRGAIAAVFTSFLLLFGGPAATGQTPSPLFSAGSTSYLPHFLGWVNQVLTADLDGDGDLDILLGVGTSSYYTVNPGLRLFLNDGEGRFRDASSTHLPPIQPKVSSISAGDVDGDGDIDIAVGTYLLPPGSGRDFLLLNNGNGKFQEAPSTKFPSLKEKTGAVLLLDVDGDGDRDLYIALTGKTDLLLLNNGKGVFHKAPAGMIPFRTDTTDHVAAGDLDGDGDPDLVVWPTGYGKNAVLFNDGLGTFTEIPGKKFNGANTDTTRVVLADVDKDGDLDIVEANQGLVRLHLNDGKGKFNEVTSTHMPSKNKYFCNGLAAGDVDGDGDIDLFLGNRFSALRKENGQNALLLNDGKGFFSEAPPGRIPVRLDRTNEVCLADLDKDGDLDILSWNIEQQSFLYFNDGKGAFRDLSQGFPSEKNERTLGLTTGDFNGDGNQDVLFLHDPSGPALFLGDGHGHFRAAPATGLPVSNFSFLASGDLDGDGDADILLSRYGSLKLYLNDGKGRFKDSTPGRFPTKNYKASFLVLFDADGDGDPDLLVDSYTYGGSPPLLLLVNDGKGFFADGTSLLPGSLGTGRPFPSDFDGNGKLDIYLLVPGGQDRLLLNFGRSGFLDYTFPCLPLRKNSALSVCFGDFDGDGDQDIVLGEFPKPVLYLNDGKGFFSISPLSQVPSLHGHPLALASGDFDNDGDLDIAVGIKGYTRGECPNTILLNDGKARFKSFPSLMPGLQERTVLLVAVDIDTDGDLDLVLGNSDSFHPDSDRIYFNLTRQVRLPGLPRLGFNLSVEIHSRPPQGGEKRLVLPLFSSAGRKTHLPPLGVLGLDPGLLFALPPLFTDPRENQAVLRLPVPRTPALAGAKIFLQGLVREGKSAGSFRFTNTAAETILNL